MTTLHFRYHKTMIKKNSSITGHKPSADVSSLPILATMRCRLTSHLQSILIFILAWVEFDI